MSAKKKPPAKKKLPAKRNRAKAASTRKTTARTRPAKKGVLRQAPKRASVKAKPAARWTRSAPVSPEKKEFDSYVRRLMKCTSVEELRKCSEGKRRGDPTAWQKTFDVVLFGLSYKDEAGRSARDAIKEWSYARLLDEKLSVDQYNQIIGRLGLAPPPITVL